MEYHHWRGSKEWAEFGLPLSTPSDEACKMFDATLTQYIRWHSDDTIGGLENTIKKMLEADPNFVMGLVIKNGITLLGTGVSIEKDPATKERVALMTKLATTTSITDREKWHAQAIEFLANRYLDKACRVWEEILLNYPLDILALRLAYFAYVYQGLMAQLRDSVARVMPHWKPDMPLYSYLMGMYAFGLEETNLYSIAEKTAWKGLELNPYDTLATHALAHIFEHQGRFEEGISFLSSTVKDWSPMEMRACHNFWHWGVFNIEKGNYQETVRLYDTEVGRRCNKPGVLANITDASSMLLRLELEGIDVGNRWEDLYKTCLLHVDDHTMTLGDVHVLIGCLKHKDTAQQMIDGIRDAVRDGDNSYNKWTRKIGLTVYESLIAYGDGDYAAAVDILFPKRYDVTNMGGSNAQRDLLNIFLINTCLKSPKKDHLRLGRHLLVERKAAKDNAPMTDRLMAKATAAILA